MGAPTAGSHATCGHIAHSMTWEGALVVLLLFLLPVASLAQSSLSSCAESVRNATVVFPDTIAITVSDTTAITPPISPSAIAVFSPRDECVGVAEQEEPPGAARWGKTEKTIAVARGDDLGTNGLKSGEPLQFRVYTTSGVGEAQASFVACSALSSDIGPICRDDGMYEEDVVYVLRELTITQMRKHKTADANSGSAGSNAKSLGQSLDVVYRNGSVHLRWEAIGEAEVTGFEVQRKTLETGTWRKLGLVRKKGAASEPTSHRFVDERLPYEADSLFYRLKWIGTEGTIGYSTKISVARGIEHIQLLSPYPNPVSQRTTLRYSVPDRQDVAISLYDALGRKIRTVVDGKREGRQQTKLNVQRLPSGTYFLRLATDGKVQTERLIVVR